jgi:hypothetical protein
MEMLTNTNKLMALGLSPANMELLSVLGTCTKVALSTTTTTQDLTTFLLGGLSSFALRNLTTLVLLLLLKIVLTTTVLTGPTSTLIALEVCLKPEPKMLETLLCTKKLFGLTPSNPLTNGLLGLS